MKCHHEGYDFSHFRRALDEELDEEPGYSEYDHRNKDSQNSRNGHS